MTYSVQLGEAVLSRRGTVGMRTLVLPPVCSDFWCTAVLLKQKGGIQRM